MPNKKLIKNYCSILNVASFYIVSQQNHCKYILWLFDVYRPALIDFLVMQSMSDFVGCQ